MESKFEELSLAFDKVFDEKGEIRACGRAACMYLISLMNRYSSENVGDENTGKINIETMKHEYFRICG